MFIYLLYSVGTNIINHQFPNSDCCQASSRHSGIVDIEPTPSEVSPSESEQPRGKDEPDETREIEVGGHSEDTTSEQAVEIVLKLCFYMIAVVLTGHVIDGVFPPQK